MIHNAKTVSEKKTMAPKSLSEEEIKKRLFKRFWNNVLLGDGCWEWQGTKTEFGHGHIQVRVDGEWYVEVASRVAWYLATGEWPTLQVLHTCDNPGCMRHSHHFQGTQMDNVHDCMNKGRAKKRHETHCKRGHDLTNAYVHQGRRHCRKCRRDQKRRAVATQ